MQVELHRVIGCEDLLVGECEVEIDSFFELLILSRGQHRVPLFRFSQTVDDFGLSEIVFEVDVVDVRFVWFEGVFVDKEVVQVAAHQRFVIANRC